MDLATRKYNFIQRLFEIDEKLFSKLELVLETKKTSKTISLKKYNTELDQANLRVEKGEFYTSEEAEKAANKW